MSLETLKLTPIATHRGEGWNMDTTTSIYKKDEYTVIEIDSPDEKKEVKFRNVGALNEDASIQFEIDIYKKKSNRRTLSSFSIPASMAQLFIESIQSVKPAAEKKAKN